MLLSVMWLAWASYSWLGTHVDLDEGAVRLAMLFVMGGMLTAALAVPDAFGDSAVLFRGCIRFRAALSDRAVRNRRSKDGRLDARPSPLRTIGHPGSHHYPSGSRVRSGPSGSLVGGGTLDRVRGDDVHGHVRVENLGRALLGAPRANLHHRSRRGRYLDWYWGFRPGSRPRGRDSGLARARSHRGNVVDLLRRETRSRQNAVSRRSAARLGQSWRVTPTRISTCR